jgi:hypothetical protein
LNTFYNVLRALSFKTLTNINLHITADNNLYFDNRFIDCISASSLRNRIKNVKKDVSRLLFSVPFVNKSIEFINLPHILNEKSITDSIPPGFSLKEPPIYSDL